MTHLRWHVECKDSCDRERAVIVLVERGQVVIVTPPGEAAIMTLPQTAQLRHAIEEAAAYIIRANAGLKLRP